MSLINLRDRTINAKIVYYGTALSGKTTSLQHVHRVVDPEGRTELVSLNTDGDRTLFFDFLPIPLGKLGGFQVKLQAFTVPGQVKYAVTRRYVLRGADGVVFVADSGPNALNGNLDALRGLRENLDANGLDPDRLPLLIQYNKRDMPGALEVAELRAALNPRGVPDLPTIATTGEGVFESFSQLCGDVLESLAAEFRIADPDEVRRQLDGRLGLLEREFAGGVAVSHGLVARAGGRMLVPETAEDSGERASIIHTPSETPLDSEANTDELLEQALSANMEAARLLADLHETRRDLAEHVRQLAALHETGTAIASDLGTEGVLRQVLGAALEAVGTDWGAVVLRNTETGRVSARLTRGADGPLGQTILDEPEVAPRLLAGQPFVLEGAELGVDSDASAALVAPLLHHGEVLGAFVAYADSPMTPGAATARLRFLGAIAAQAAVALVNARLYERIESFNRELELRVAERTRELEEAYEELRALDALKDDFLASMSHELLTPLTSITGFAEILGTTAAEGGETAAAERSEFAGIVQRESERLATMLQSVLDLSMLESGQAALVREPLDLPAALRNAHATLIERIGAQNVRVRVRMQQGLPPVIGDERWLERVFYELLSNACKFSPESDPVVVTARVDGDAVLVQFDDAGPGVLPDQRAAVFDKFKQVGDVLIDKPAGLGLGLPMSRLVIDQLGGSLDVAESDAGGASFRVRLPAAVAPVPAN